MAKNTITPFGAAVKKALKEQHKTQVQLAEQVGTTKQYVYMILYGFRPGKRYVEKIAKICKIDLKKIDKQKHR